MRRSSSRGQAVVEFALVLPILLLLVLGTVDFGMLFLTKSRVEAASAVGARVAALGGTDAQITNAVTSSLPGAQVGTIQPGQGSRSVGTEVNVPVFETYKFLTPIIEPFFGASSIQVSGTTSMVVEVAPPP